MTRAAPVRGARRRQRSEQSGAGPILALTQTIMILTLVCNSLPLALAKVSRRTQLAGSAGAVNPRVRAMIADSADLEDMLEMTEAVACAEAPCPRLDFRRVQFDSVSTAPADKVMMVARRTAAPVKGLARIAAHTVDLSGIGEHSQLGVYRRQADILTGCPQASVEILRARELTRLVEERGDGTLLARRTRSARNGGADRGRRRIAARSPRAGCISFHESSLRRRSTVLIIIVLTNGETATCGWSHLRPARR